MQRLLNFFDKRHPAYSVLFVIGLWVLGSLALGMQGCSNSTPITRVQPRFHVGQMVYTFGMYEGRIFRIDTSNSYPLYAIQFPWTASNWINDSDISLVPCDLPSVQQQVTTNFQQIRDDFMNRDNTLTDKQQWVNAAFYNTDVQLAAAMYEFKNMSPNVTYCPSELYARMKNIDSIFKLEKIKLAKDLEPKEKEQVKEENK